MIVNEVEDLINTYKQVVSKSMIIVNIKKAREATRADGSLLEFGLDKQLQTFYSKIKGGLPKENKQVDNYLKNLSQSSALLSKWLEDFKANFSQYPEQAQPTIREVESALQYYKDTIAAALEARKMRQANEPDAVDKVLGNIKDAFSSLFGPSYKVVEISRESVKGRLKAVEDKISQSVGTKIYIQYNLDSFVDTPAFKGKPNSKQAEIINALFGTLPEIVFGNHLLSILQFQLAKESFVRLFKSVSINMDITNSVPQEGTVTNAQGTLCVTVNMVHSLEIVRVTNWRERILDVMGILVDIACLETDNIQQQITNSLHAFLGKPIQIVLLLPCVYSPDFTTLHPSRRIELTKLANTKLIEVLLLGDAGITGNQSICEFKQVIEAFTAKVSKIVIAVESHLSCAGLRHEDGTIYVGIPLQDLNRGTFQGLGQAFERLLELRSVRLEAAIQQANETIASSLAPLSSMLGENKPIRVDWSFLSAPEWTNAPNYVQIIKHVTAIVQEMMVATGKGFNASLFELASQRSWLQKSLSELSSITICCDPKNSIDVRTGNSHTLVARVFQIQLNTHDLVITTNLNILPSNMPGVGRVVEFKLNTVEAYLEEERTIRQIEENMRRDEEHYRQSQIERVIASNEEKTKQYQRDQEYYRRDIAEYHREVNAKCNYCSGRGLRKCGLCGGRGETTNNHNVSTCWSCNGKGEIACSNCDGTALKHPRGLTEPQAPSEPYIESVPQFGEMPNFRSMI